MGRLRQMLWALPGLALTASLLLPGGSCGWVDDRVDRGVEQAAEQCQKFADDAKAECEDTKRILEDAIKKLFEALQSIDENIAASIQAAAEAELIMMGCVEIPEPPFWDCPSLCKR